MDHLRQVAQADAGDHRQGDLVDHFAGMADDDGRAEDPVGTFGDVDLHEADVLAVGTARSTSCIGMVKVVTGMSASHRLAHVQADMGDLGIGIGTPRNDQFARALAAATQRVGTAMRAMRRRDMGELVLQADVAGGIDAGLLVRRKSST